MCSSYRGTWQTAGKETWVIFKCLTSMRTQQGQFFLRHTLKIYFWRCDDTLARNKHVTTLSEIPNAANFPFAVIHTWWPEMSRRSRNFPFSKLISAYIRTDAWNMRRRLDKARRRNASPASRDAPINQRRVGQSPIVFLQTKFRTSQAERPEMEFSGLTYARAEESCRFWHV